jgi:uncharacterized protein YyaL (SSP411 family)
MAAPSPEPIHWRPWGQEAFDQARRDNKLILLDSGATWCHWCHVMDEQTYQDPTVIRVINERFVPVRIDRDRLPEVDAQLQSAIPLIPSQAGGWPLVAVITPEGQTLVKASFLPPRADPLYGAERGLIDLLETIDEHWRQNRQSIQAAAERLGANVRREYPQRVHWPGEMSDSLVREVIAGLESAYDPQHGGFGSAPKFYAAPALELLSVLAWRGQANARSMLDRTLEGIYRGGVYDHLAGGFHRYSVDERWHVPHFEKLACDNAALLSLYAHASRLTGREDFAQVARATWSWADATLGGRAGGGFFASQDADAQPGDDGDYFTWTVPEVQAAVGERSDLALAAFGVDDVGDVHGRFGRNVLHLPRPFGVQARLLGMQEAELVAAVTRAKARMLAARSRRPAPPVDTTIFADVNGMMIDAYLTCYERLDEPPARQTGLAAMEAILATLRDPRGVFAHYRRNGHLEGVGGLADQAWMARAAIHAFAASGHSTYLQVARAAADYILAELTAEDGSFRNVPSAALAGPALTAWPPGWEDTSVRNPGTVAAEVLLDLGSLTGQERYAAAARTALAGFASGVRREYGLFLSGYALAVDRALNGPQRIIVTGPAGADRDALTRLARQRRAPGALVVELSPANEEHREVLRVQNLPLADRPTAYVCRGRTCLAPASDPRELVERLAQPSGP